MLNVNICHNIVHSVYGVLHGLYNCSPDNQDQNHLLWQHIKHGPIGVRCHPRHIGHKEPKQYSSYMGKDNNKRKYQWTYFPSE